MAEDNTCRPLRLEKGESLFLYTDGLVENRGPEGEVFRVRRLQKFLEENMGDANLKTKILEAAQLIWKDEKPLDDCTFLVVKRVEPYHRKGCKQKAI
tara:strand:+ start:232 stop:522 length:291 start_codon:yes stop_codon:yes gene_type:complete